MPAGSIQQTCAQAALQMHDMLARHGLRYAQSMSCCHEALQLRHHAKDLNDIPVVQLSLHANMDPATHLKAGQLLAPVRDEGVLIIGSGMSYHNLQRLDRRGQQPSEQFDAWLLEALVKAPTVERIDRLLHWTQAPAARLVHPREDHLLPLMVAVGAAEDEPGTCVYHQRDLFGSITCSSYRFGAGQ